MASPPLRSVWWTLEGKAMKSLLFVGVLVGGMGVGSCWAVRLMPGVALSDKVDDSPNAQRQRTIAGIRTNLAAHREGTVPMTKETAARLEKRLAELERE